MEYGTGNRKPEPESGTGIRSPESGIQNRQIKENRVLQIRKMTLHIVFACKNKEATKKSLQTIPLLKKGFPACPNLCNRYF